MPGAKRIAVVLFNLGGPDSPSAVEPFLFNLFNDPAIIGLPNPFRWLLAKLIARRRAPTARNIYAKIGGRSPILPNTEAQASALAQQLGDLGTVAVYCCMRYWHPMTGAVVAAVKSFGPDEIILLPLYPQFSSTTTASSDRAWRKAAAKAGLAAPMKLICCYPTEPGFVAAAATLVQAGIAESRAKLVQAPRVLFSAHGLPKKIVERGDPYPGQVERSARVIAAQLGLQETAWRVCYQSRVGPLAWIAPSTDEEIRVAGKETMPIVLFPIAFVSEHSETLVELDMEYRHLAERSGVPSYIRVPTVGTSPDFIAGLAEMVRATITTPAIIRPQAGERLCAAAETCCVYRAA